MYVCQTAVIFQQLTDVVCTSECCNPPTIYLYMSKCCNTPSICMFMAECCNPPTIYQCMSKCCNPTTIYLFMSECCNPPTIYLCISDCSNPPTIYLCMSECCNLHVSLQYPTILHFSHSSIPFHSSWLKIVLNIINVVLKNEILKIKKVAELSLELNGNFDNWHCFS